MPNGYHIGTGFGLTRFVLTLLATAVLFLSGGRQSLSSVNSLNNHSPSPSPSSSPTQSQTPTPTRTPTYTPSPTSTNTPIPTYTSTPSDPFPGYNIEREIFRPTGQIKLFRMDFIKTDFKDGELGNIIFFVYAGATSGTRDDGSATGLGAMMIFPGRITKNIPIIEGIDYYYPRAAEYNCDSPGNIVHENRYRDGRVMIPNTPEIEQMAKGFCRMAIRYIGQKYPDELVLPQHTPTPLPTEGSSGNTSGSARLYEGIRGFLAQLLGGYQGR
ncbi:MAG: hypothetical protein J4428_05380 [Candidatus Aenigmarchaeota archaeon]|nr:hypothetical protein [Candidatus Aenigmarchaeota archaeon]